jgi:hypothetical protein
MPPFMGRVYFRYAPGAYCKLRWRETVQSRARSDLVVVDPAFFDNPSGFQQVGEDVLVETLLAQPTIGTPGQALQCVKEKA